MKKRQKKYIKRQNKINVKTRKKIPILKLLFFLSFLIMSFVLVLKNTDNIQNIFTKKNKIKAPQEYTADDLQIGDIVYYNHKDVIKLKSEDTAIQEKYNKMQKDHETNQTVTINVGDSKTPGSGHEKKGIQTFNAKAYNTTWRVWDKLSDGRVMLVSNKSVPQISLYSAVGYIWWEHTAHKVASILGYGEGADVGITNIGESTGANKSFSYKVGSGIDDAPDMIELKDPTDPEKGRQGEWKIGEEVQDKINISAARSLTLPEVENKLGITEEGIKDKTTSSGTNSAPGYGIQTTTSMTYVVQRDINSPNQIWENEEDRKIGKAKNKTPGYKMTDRYYYWKQNSIPDTKYKEMLFNGNWTGLATNALNVYNGGEKVYFNSGHVTPLDLGISRIEFVHSDGSSFYRWTDYYEYPWLCIVVYLKSKIKYIPAGANAWDIYQPSSEDKDVKLKVLNLSSASIDKIGIKASKVNTEGVLPEDVTKETKTSTKI